MTGLQRLLLFFIPRRHRAEAEAESRAWHLVCNACGHARSVWDLGGVRWKASGNPVTRARCKMCGTNDAHTVEKRAPT